RMVASPESQRELVDDRSKRDGNRSICAGRCVCLHAFSQWTTLAFESLLLHHGLLSSPFSLLEGEKEAEGGMKMREALRRVMKGRRHEDIREILLCFGISPLSLSRIYRLPVEVCCEEEKERENGGVELGEEERELTKCGSPCAALNAAEQRRINRYLFGLFPPEAKSSKTQRVYVVVRGNDGLLSEDLTEMDDLSRAKDGEITLEWTHVGCGRRLKGERREERRDNESIVMRMKQFM
ncbi:hypothetical protein PFISCL1PPCAC_19139, partial [Pristionchus fissidentatus]